MGLKDDILIRNLIEIKRLYEEAIRTNGTAGIHSLIRSSKLIMLIHDYIKEELIAHGITPDYIYPPRGQTSPEIKFMGFLKGKNQDISVVPGKFRPEKITEGVLLGKTDQVGKELSNKSITINIRSQLSSISKNFDTLYERTFAEALNLHLRLPNAVLGEVYLIPLIAYDPAVMDSKQISFKEQLPAMYIPAFQEINNRTSTDSDDYKYERVCLLIIDFRTEIPTIINEVQQIVDAGVISQQMGDKISLNGLTISSFVSDILKKYENRNGSIVPLKIQLQQRL